MRAPVIRISLGVFDAEKSGLVEAKLVETRERLAPGICAMRGNLGYFVGIDRVANAMHNVSLWETVEDANQMASFQPMLDLASVFVALGVRRFTDRRMTEAYGPDWPWHRLPNDLYEKWARKKQRAEDAGGRVWPLIAYADFTDYELVLCRGDNWREVFVRYFSRPESVRETFQRLYPIRLDTMHARPITQDDELLLYVETRRLMKVTATAMGRQARR